MRREAYLYAGVSGILLGIGFVVPALWWCALVGLVPFLYSLEQSISRTLLGTFLRGWVLGVILHGFAFFGIFWHTLPVTWFGISSTAMQIIAVAGSWLLFAVVPAVGTALFVLGYRHLRSGTAFDLATIPALWVLGEWAGRFLFSIVLAGPGSLIGAHFSLGYIGYLLANDAALLQAAWLGGVYALSFTAIALNLLWYRTLFGSKSIRMRYGGMLLGIAAVLVAGHVTLSKPLSEAGTALTVATIATNAPPMLYISPEEEENRSATLYSLIMKAPKNADLIVLPESTAFFRDFKGIFPDTSALIVDSHSSQDSSGFVHSRAYFRYPDEHMETSAKQLLLPIGEYVPYFYRIFLAFASEEFRTQVIGTRAFAPADEFKFGSLDDTAFTVRFCDEVMDPHLYADDAAQGANVLVNVSSHSWFHGSPVVFFEMQNIAKVRAVESRRWFVQSSNMVPAFILDSYGRIVGQTAWGNGNTLAATVMAREGVTPYLRFGYLVIPTMVALILIGVLLRRRYQIRN